MSQERDLCYKEAFVALRLGLRWWHYKQGQDCATRGHSFGPVECVSSHNCCLLCWNSRVFVLKLTAAAMSVAALPCLHLVRPSVLQQK